MPAAVPVRWTYSAIGVEPTKLTAATSSWASSASTASLSPLTTFSTPGGAPASTASSASRRPQDGSFSEGFSTKVLPQARATGYIHIGTMAGKLKGVMPAHTPSGWRTLKLSTLPATFSFISPLRSWGDPARELDDLDAAGDRSAGVVEGLAMFGGADAGQLLAVRFEDVAVAEQDARALRRRGRRPRGERRLRRPDRPADLARGRERHPRLDLPGRRVVDVAEAVALAGDALAVDEVLEGGDVRIVAGHGFSPEG